MGRRIIILIALSLVFALSGRDVFESDLLIDDSCLAFHLESSITCADAGTVSAFAISTITSGLNYSGSLKNHKHNIHYVSRRFFQTHDVFLIQGKHFHHPMSTVKDTFRRIAALMKFLI